MSERTFNMPDAEPPLKAKPKWHRCWECGRRAEHEHHVIPKVLGGKRTLWLCLDCHAKIHDRRMMASSQLTRAGLQKAKARGIKLGRRKGDVGHKWDPNRPNPARRTLNPKEIRLLYDQGVKVREIAERFKCSKVAVYQALKETGWKFQPKGPSPHRSHHKARHLGLHGGIFDD